MNYQTKESFFKDLKSIKDKAILLQVRNFVKEIEKAKTIDQISNVKKLKGHKKFFRKRISNHRLGFYLDGDTLVLLRFMHRKKIYNKFP